MLTIKSIITEIKNTFDGLIGRSDMTEERFNEVENMLTEPFQTETQRLKNGGGPRKGLKDNF